MLSAALCLCIRVYAGVCARHMLKYLIAERQVVAVNGSWQQAAVQWNGRAIDSLSVFVY